ncbi:NigD-like N-terminal domain-containing protein [Flavobacteriaceae sp. LMIT009]
MRYKSTILSVFIIALIMGCGNESKCGNDAATGHFKDLNGLDGCGMIIELDNGNKLNPINREEINVEAVDGQKVSLTYTKLEDAMSICMVGDMVKINCIEVQ